jgi:CubicO group peptidase (beta-lactamase class C family)
MKLLYRASNLLFSFIIILGSVPGNTQPITSAQVDELVERTLKTFDVPGIAVAIVKDGKVIHAKGYGVRSLNTKQKVDENTLYGVASNTKAFTAAALGMLIDEGKLTWDSKVIDFIPEFRMYNPYVTDAFTIRDLLTHRSGLGLGAGDLMFWPDSSDFQLKDILHNMQYLKPVSGFRTKYDYDNLLYIVAGEVVTRISGMSWEDFVETRIIQPLGMTKTATSFARLKDKSNVIEPHAPVNGTLSVIKRDWSTTANAAGGINSSVADMSKWIIMQMNHGLYGEGLTKRMFSEKVHEEMWSAQTIIPVGATTAYNTHFQAYGLGWNLSDVHGYKQATHTGGLAGNVTQVTLIPEINLGIIVLTNQQVGAAFSAITNTIKDSYFGIQGRDWVKQLNDNVIAQRTNAQRITDDIWKTIEANQKATKFDIRPYTGTYNDPWFGSITISEKNGKAYFNAVRAPRLTGELLPYKGNTFIVKWKNRSFDADAYVMFSLDSEGKAAGIKMKSISPLTDFSFDFHDLEFSKVN